MLNVEYHSRQSNSSRGGTQTGGRDGGRNHRGGRGGRNGRGGGRGRSGGSGPSPFAGGWGGVSPWQMNYPLQRGLLPLPPAMAQWPYNTINRNPQQYWPNSAPNNSTWPNNNAVQSPRAMYSIAQPTMQPHTMQFFRYPFNADQATSLPQAFSSMSLQDLGNSEWYMDTRATAHLHNNPCILNSFSNKCIFVCDSR